MAVDMIARAIGAAASGGGGISGKADKVSGAVSGDLAGLNSSGNLTDSGYAPSDFSLATQFINDTSSTTYGFIFADMQNKEVRLKAADISAISFTLDSTPLADDYLAGINFASGATPPHISYTDSGIINWVGTDCTLSGTDSVFTPQASKQYDIVFYNNGTYIIGVVNGYTPASGNQ